MKPKKDLLTSSSLSYPRIFLQALFIWRISPVVLVIKCKFIDISKKLLNSFSKDTSLSFAFNSSVISVIVKYKTISSDLSTLNQTNKFII